MDSELMNFLPLLIFGNIENLILAAQGVSVHVDPVGLSLLSIAAVICWLLIGTFGTKIAMKYARFINFVGGLAIFILGIQAMIEVLPDMLVFFR